MATLTAQTFDVTGAQLSFAAATGGGGDLFTPQPGDDRTFLWVKNGGGGSINVTISVAGSTFGQLNTDIVKAVGAGTEQVFSLLPSQAGDDTFGFIVITYSGVTSVTVAVARMATPPPNLP